MDRRNFHFFLVWWTTWTQTRVGQPENIEILKTQYEMKNCVPPRVQHVIICHVYLANLGSCGTAGPGVYQAPPSSHPRKSFDKIGPENFGPEFF